MGLAQPKFEDIAGGGAMMEEVQVKNFPIHVKKGLAIIEHRRILRLEMTEEMKRKLEHVFQWIEEEEMYKDVPVCTARQLPPAKLTREHIELLVAEGHIESVPDRRCVKGYVKVFGSLELFKGRIRIIKWTRIINETLGKETLIGIRMSGKKEAVALACKGPWIAAVDAKGFYDQIGLSENVRDRFCFRWRKQIFRLRRLATGQRQAVDIAGSIMEALLDFDRRTSTETCIDNVIFAGEYDDVLRDLTIFLQRCDYVGVALNEIESNATEEEIKKLITQRAPVLGVDVDVERREVRLLQKAIDKLNISWRNRELWTWRNFAAHIGLLFWSVGILDIPMTRFFPLLRFISHVGRLMQEDENRWDEPASLWLSAIPALDEWTSIVARNEPRRVSPAGVPDWALITDASAEGWGYVALNTTTGEIHMHGDAWSWQMRKKFGDMLRHSTTAEPAGIWCAIHHLVKPGDNVRLCIGTDNMAARAVYTRGYHSSSQLVNDCLHELREKYGDKLTIQKVVHVPGATNIADGLSRGASASAVDGQAAAQCLRQLMGGVSPSQDV